MESKPEDLLHHRGNIYYKPAGRKFHPKEKGDRYGRESFFIQGKPIMHGYLMVYTWSYGGRKFDIRTVRAKVGLQEEYRVDYGHPCKSMEFVLDQLSKIAETHDLEDLIFNTPHLDPPPKTLKTHSNWRVPAGVGPGEGGTSK